jgi:hypothetical protein
MLSDKWQQDIFVPSLSANKKNMPIKITWQYIIAFIALHMIMGELYEQVHINTGYFIFGCYGPRDFNVWQTCESRYNREPYRLIG